jgi:hypothetical protein
MAAQPARWNGTQAESRALAAALQRHCTCRTDPTGERVVEVCPPHRMLQEDQRALDGLLCYRHLRERLQREELTA